MIYKTRIITLQHKNLKPTPIITQKIIIKKTSTKPNNTPIKTQTPEIRTKTITNHITKHTKNKPQTYNTNIDKNSKYYPKLPYTPGMDVLPTPLKKY